MLHQYKGFKIPSKEHWLIVTLFANVTTVYSRQNDDIGNLFRILNKWCIASGAKFNITKSIVLLLGTPTYRQEVIINHRNMPSTTQIDTNIHIAKEKEPIQILGGWVGNGIDNEAMVE